MPFRCSRAGERGGESEGLPCRTFLELTTSPSQPATWRRAAFYDRPFGARTHLDYAPESASHVPQIALGGALLSIHQAGNGLDLVATHPTVGGADICLRWP